MLLLATAWSCAARTESADLRPGFKEGRTTYYRVGTKVTRKFGTLGPLNEMPLLMEAEVRLKVLRVHPGGADVEYTLLYLRTDGGPPNFAMTFDSGNPEARGANQGLVGLINVINKPIVLKVSMDGAIQEAKGLSTLGKSIPTEISGLLSEDILRRHQQSMFPGQRAPNPVKAGSTWESKTKSAMPPAGEVVRSMKSTLKRVDSATRTAHVDLRMTMELKPSEEGASVGYSLREGKGNGRLTWDLSTGELLHSEIEEHMSLQMGGPDARPGERLNMIHTSTTTTERVTPDKLNVMVKEK
jgi:hypothetical protein